MSTAFSQSKLHASVDTLNDFKITGNGGITREVLIMNVVLKTTPAEPLPTIKYNVT